MSRANSRISKPTTPRTKEPASPTKKRPAPPTTKSSPERSSRRLPLAQTADPHDLYERAVQAVDAEIDFVDQTFRSLRGRQATTLREDFCGTANSSAEWVRRRRANTAIGLDIDAPTLAWAQSHTRAALKPAQQARLELRNASVLDDHADLRARFDVVLAMNFSYFCMKTRERLLAYFRNVHKDLKPDGVFFLDYYGGSDAHRLLKERRKIKSQGKNKPGFTYIWEQRALNPITGEITCAIRFKLADGSMIRDAYTYDWRLWSIAELRDVLADAGFSRSAVYWEGDDGKGGGNGDFQPTEKGEACAAYIGYITAEK